ncbi:MAG: hypothetical protein GEU90_14245 [Gemmatimonas sp.]|nr:hypothetical protein [Gemmatimonas sp.]
MSARSRCLGLTPLDCLARTSSRAACPGGYGSRPDVPIRRARFTTGPALRMLQICRSRCLPSTRVSFSLVVDDFGPTLVAAPGRLERPRTPATEVEHMNGRHCASLVALAMLLMSPNLLLGQANSATETGVRSSLVGAYRLISYVTWDREDVQTTTPFTEGTIMYDPSGRMSVHLRHADRSVTPGRGPTEAVRAQLYSSYIAYYGSYSIHPAEGYVIHHVEGGLSPALGGTDQVRYYQLSPDARSLTLQVRNDGRLVGEVQWERYR